MKKQRLSSKGWLVLFCATVASIFLVLWPLVNILVDPFGAFGDPIFQWWSYNETMSPRVAKISYLDKHHEKYDSYILGCSSTSSFPVETFNQALDANFYNLIVYGSDLYDTEHFAKYVIDNYQVKNLVVNVYIGNGSLHNVGETGFENTMPYHVSGTSALTYYKTHLFADPQYALEKLRCRAEDGYVQAVYDVFEVESGAYDKSRRDAEGIGDLETYLAQPEYAEFMNYPQRTMSLGKIEEAAASIASIKAMCEENDVRLIVAACPVYAKAMDWCQRQEVEAFYTAIANVTDFWDFSYSSVSFEPRYFYDATHFRNSVGEMMCARMFGDTTRYVPEDFGFLVTKDNAAEYFETYWDVTVPETISAQVPILLYHHLAEEGDGGAAISISTFERQMASLKEAGYTAVTFDDLERYAVGGEALPEKPVLITFDDGYESNYAYAYPILERYGLKGTIFTIGVSVGKDTYKETGAAMTPHFSWAQALEMEESGVITVESHGYNFHEVEGRDASPIRQGILQKEGESEEDYIAFLNHDCDTMHSLFQEHLGKQISVVAFPYGKHDTLSDILLTQNGIKATVTTQERTNTIIKGLPQSLYNLGRFSVGEDTDVLALLEERAS